MLRQTASISKMCQQLLRWKDGGAGSAPVGLRHAAWRGVHVADHAAEVDQSPGSSQRAPEGDKAHHLRAAWLLLGLSCLSASPSWEVHEGAMTLSLPTFFLQVKIMATKPTLPSSEAEA